ncbi:MAG: Hsp70 family protein [Deltaproteobacteria bacterium]|nr:Hsp70 family protein [Deltaproteobacteria bacterium]MBW2014351.1 Hsp70 family protein [Deltaproteobacteria bacterium]MBW2088674.1 Hsp70 family protein [Deltaproteobacteria bacterium]MBW2320525.1 Hsp70 family protein [Deltaproteobacteria bacterium]
MHNPVYIIGIDLGTTNSVVAYTEADTEMGRPSEIRLFEIPQLIDAGVVEKRRMLPSFVLVPGEHDVSQTAMALPWQETSPLAVGEFAKNRGVELPNRLIASSKSWLCHTLVDRNKPILPWEGPEEKFKKSPVEASAAILQHIRDAWNHAMAADDESLKMENQEILLTVPASFDAVARELTVKAAEISGLNHVTLLEEPQAAFYAWIESTSHGWRDMVTQGDLVLVCDVGGGTTDFSLIKISEEQGELALDRIAVGEHLLVGGDNMDLALAYSISRQMADNGTRLDAWQMRGLWHSCRNAKERLLSDPDAQEYPITVLGRGSGLIGGTVKTVLSRDAVEKVLLDGFFPVCERTTRPVSPQKTGIRELGLPYASDPAVTHHLAEFLQQNNGESLPTMVLFNGGVIKAKNVRNRIMEVMTSWKASEDAPPIREIPSNDFDLAVARGAVYYGMAKRGRGVRIRYGLNKSYYVGIAASMPAVPGIPAPLKALCVAPFGMEEGTGATLENQEFALVVGEPVNFDFLSSMRHDHDVGTVVEDWEGEIRSIAEIQTTLDGELGSVIPVTLEIRVTEVGILELWCVSREDGRRWKLEFNVREKETLGS